jgi:hypothetical protein
MDEEERPLTEEEIDERVIAQADDNDAWDEEIVVTPTRAAEPAAVQPASRRRYDGRR